MRPHDTFLQLAAIAIDFPLDAAERRRLDQHLAGCQACAHTATMLRGDALALVHLPPVRLPERRGAEIIAAAVHPSPVPITGRLLLVAALLGLLLLGSVAAGAELIRRMTDDDLSVMPPVPSLDPSAAPDSSPLPGQPAGALAVTRIENGTRWIELMTMDGTSTRLAEGRDPAWLTAERIVYTCPDGGVEGGMDTGICAIDVRPPGQPRVLVTGADRPAPAPDGRLVAFHRGMVDVGETWVMAADGSSPRLVHSGAFDRWAPDGAWLAGQPESAAVEIAVVGVDGQGFQVLAPGYDPAWSPEGDRITYVAVDEAGAYLREVYPKGGVIDTLVEAPADTSLAAPALAADERRMFVRDGDLWMFDQQAGGASQVTDGLEIPGGPASDPLAITPDGAWVAFTNGAGDAAWVGMIRSDTGAYTTFPWAGPVMQPAWAPTGGRTATPPPAPSPDVTATTDATPAPVAAEPLGTTWQAAQMPVVPGRPVGRVEAVTAGGPGFVAVGRGCVDDTCEVVVWTSTDGNVWQRVPASDALRTEMVIPTSGPELGMFDVAAGAPGIVAIGNAARPEMEASAWFSPDGVTWQRFTLGDASTQRIHAVTWDGRRFVAVGTDRGEWNGTLKGMAKARARATAWISPDGRTWTQVPHSDALDAGGFKDTTEDPSTGGMADVASGPGGLVAVGSTCSSTPLIEPPACEPAIWTSVDGVSWERAPGVPSLSGSLEAISTTGSGYVAVGATQTCDASEQTDPWGCPALILSSPDGRTWTQRPIEQPGSLGAITTIGGRYVAWVPGIVATLWTSDDGSAWAPAGVKGGAMPSLEGPRLAATSDTAVWIGTDPETTDPAAWVSVQQPDR